ncbi:MAG: hypothetical protein KKE62_01345 [Proteobacteria bacterium]|nr:hypothetical protein [Pseudomonadota bacterium]MBU1541464.1 hypothetical protein [Pseudomonadota bacterium]MBU2431962.1 hypothetical protein [Pseudomonadota bacterium]MBU2480300.1 hypothetical protein [Pseudomonadota bacterium]
MELNTDIVDIYFFGSPRQIFMDILKGNQNLYYIFTSTVIGFIAWDNYVSMAVLLPVIWAQATTKKTAYLIGLGYHLAASRGLIVGIPVFFGSNDFYGIFLWLLAGFIQAIPYFLCSYIRNTYLAIFILLVALILPPICIIGWVNPLTAAGMIFPGTGFFGLFLTLDLIWLMTWQYKNKLFLTVLILFLIVFPLVVEQTATSTPDIKGTITKFSGNPANIGDKFSKDYEKFITTYNQFGGSDFKVLVLPESTAGIWFDSTKNLWGKWQRNLKEGQGVVLSTLLPDGKGAMEAYNTLILMTKNEFKVLYMARQSVPVAMWKPWSNDNVKTNWFESPIFEINDKKATALICYEAYLTWPILHSFIVDDPETILFVSNHWWSKNTSLLSIQKTCVQSWANLFNVQLISAVNL